MTLQLLRPEDITTAALARWGIYGENGVGKSTLLSTVCLCQEGGNPDDCRMTLVVSADQENIKPYLGKPHITVAKVFVWDDTVDVHMMLARGVKHPLVLGFIRDAITAGGPRKEAFARRLAADGVKEGASPFFQLAGFDTWTRMQALAAHKLVGAEVIAPEDTVRWLTTPPTTPRGYELWDKIGKLAADGMRSFNRLPVHTVYLLQEMSTKDKAEIERIVPALTPSALREVIALLELVGRLYVPFEKGGDTTTVTADDLAPTANRRIDPNFREERLLLLGKHELYFAKGPTHKLGYVVEQPSWATLAKSLG